MVVGGHKLDLSHVETHSSVVQLISVQTLLTIAAKNKLNVASGNAGNVFLHAELLKKAHAVAEPEFEERERCLVEIVCNEHGIASASRVFSLHFGNFIRSLRFIPMQANQNI